MNAPLSSSEFQIPISASALQRELARRAAAKQMQRAREQADEVREKCQTMRGFVDEAWAVLEPGRKMIPGWEIDAICEHLQGITEGQLDPYWIFNISPGSMKSLLVSVCWQAWEWGPRALRSHRFLSSSFELGNVTRDTRKTRDLIQSEWYQELWPELGLKRAGETSFANHYTGTREGVAFGSLTAKRGDRVTIDDPHSIDGAESEKQRDKAVNRFLEGGLNRTNDAEASAMIIIMQRLHERDLSGALLAEDLGFNHLFIPMRYEADRKCITFDRRGREFWRDPRTKDGEVMNPARFTDKALAKFERFEYSWAGQYQQRPAPREGGLLKPDKIEIIEASPGGGDAARGWDLAGTKGKKSKYTASVKIRRLPGRIIIEHADRLKGNPFEVKQRIKKLSKLDTNEILQSIPQDPGQAGVAQKRDLAEALSGRVFRFTPETGSKEMRAMPLASAIDAGMVQMVKGDWNRMLTDEMRTFPNGEYSDLVDAATRAYSELVGEDDDDDELDGPEAIPLDEGPVNRASTDGGIQAIVDDPWL